MDDKGFNKNPKQLLRTSSMSRLFSLGKRWSDI